MPNKLVTTALGIETEATPIKNWDPISRSEVFNDHVTVKGRVFEANETKQHIPALHMISSEMIPIEGAPREYIYRATIQVVRINDEGKEIVRQFIGEASCYAGRVMVEKYNAKKNENYTVDDNSDWLEKVQTKAVGRALSFAGFGNIFGSSIASAEDIMEYQRKTEMMRQGVSFEEINLRPAKIKTMKLYNFIVSRPNVAEYKEDLEMVKVAFFEDCSFEEWVLDCNAPDDLKNAFLAFREIKDKMQKDLADKAKPNASVKTEAPKTDPSVSSTKDAEQTAPEIVKDASEEASGDGFNNKIRLTPKSKQLSNVAREMDFLIDLLVDNEQPDSLLDTAHEVPNKLMLNILPVLSGFEDEKITQAIQHFNRDILKVQSFSQSIQDKVQFSSEKYLEYVTCLKAVIDERTLKELSA